MQTMSSSSRVFTCEECGEEVIEEEYEIITLDNETDSKQIMKIILGDSTMDEEFEIKLKKKALLYSNLK